MHTIRPLSLVSILCLVSTSAWAQQTASPVRDPQGVAVLTQSLNAVGGAAVIGSIEDFTGTGTITFYWAGSQDPAAVTARGMGIFNFRVDAALPTGTRTWAVSNYSGVLIAPDGSRANSAFYNLVTAGSMTLPYVRIAAALSDQSTSITYVGSVSLNGRQAYQVHLVEQTNATPSLLRIMPDLGAYDLYIDSTSFLVTELTETVRSESNFTQSYPHEIDFTNYQKVGGIQAPFAIAERIGGQETWSITLNTIAFNGGLTAAIFTP
jgi:hypothetical protein